MKRRRKGIRPCRHPRTYRSSWYKKARGKTRIINPHIKRRYKKTKKKRYNLPRIIKKRKARIPQQVMFEPFIKKETPKIPEMIDRSYLFENFKEDRKIEILTNIKNDLPQITKAVSNTISLFSGNILLNLAKHGVAYAVKYGTNEIIQGLNNSGFFEDIKEKLDLDEAELYSFKSVLRKTIEKVLEYALNKLIDYYEKIGIEKRLEEINKLENELNRTLVKEVIGFLEYTEEHGIDEDYSLKVQPPIKIPIYKPIINQDINKKEEFIIQDSEGNEHTIMVTTEIRPILKSIRVSIDIIEDDKRKWVLNISGGIGSDVSIGDMKLDPKLRSKGLGKQIYLKAEEILKNYKIKQITGTLSQVDCKTQEDRLRRNQFWRDLGFEVKEIDDRGNGKIRKIFRY